MRRQSDRIFFIFDLGVPGAVFIKLVDWMRPYIEPRKLSLAIMDHILETQDALSRFTQRLIPVDILCKAGKMEDLVEFAKPVLRQMFPQGEDRIPWCLEYKCRNNDKVQRREIQDFLCKEINLE